MSKKYKPTEMAKEVNEFDQLAEKAMPEKEKAKFIRDLEKKISKEKPTCGSLLHQIGSARHDFLLSMVDLQQLGQEYQKFRSVDIDNWTAKQKQSWRDQKKDYHKKFIKIYKSQHTSNLVILTLHKHLESRLGFTFEFSHNNIPMSMAVALACMKEDAK